MVSDCPYNIYKITLSNNQLKIMEATKYLNESGNNCFRLLNNVSSPYPKTSIEDVCYWKRAEKEYKWKSGMQIETSNDNNNFGLSR